MLYICNICSQQFADAQSLDRHINTNHKLNFLCSTCGEEAGPNPLYNSKFLCNLCRYETDDEQIHKQQHTQEYFDCEHCNKKIKALLY